MWKLDKDIPFSVICYSSAQEPEVTFFKNENISVSHTLSLHKMVQPWSSGRTMHRWTSNNYQLMMMRAKKWIQLNLKEIKNYLMVWRAVTKWWQKHNTMCDTQLIKQLCSKGTSNDIHSKWSCINSSVFRSICWNMAVICLSSALLYILLLGTLCF